ncbi:hypothetical protein FACS189450_13020 [Spirochaetia bacterium]|nr:hypothetical protein FACS189450_13020 [Spirochaetia bacterium]
MFAMPRNNTRSGKNIKNVQFILLKAFLDKLNPFCNKVQKRPLVSDVGYYLFGQIVYIFIQIIKKVKI